MQPASNPQGHDLGVRMERHHLARFMSPAETLEKDALGIWQPESCTKAGDLGLG